MKNLTQLLPKIALMLGGIVFALVIVVGVLALFPGLIPDDLRDPLERRDANQTLEIRYLETDGDLFFNLPGDVKPPEEPAVLSEHTIRTDDNGFRVPAKPAERYADYEIVVLGDSFTDAWMVAQPWPDVLAQAVARPVLNLAFRGYGPLEYSAILDEFGEETHQWVLIGYFEGNDLANIETSYRLREEGGNILTGLVREAIGEDRENYVIDDGTYRYPLALYIGADFYEQGFFDPYIWLLNGERDVYEGTRNIELLKETLADIRQQAAEDACVALVYIPSKPHIYFQYAEPFGRRWILENGASTSRNDDGWIEVSEPNQMVDFDELLTRLDNQRDVVAEAVAGVEGVAFIDLTPTFQAAAADSHMLYLTYDTHWNQDGHRLAGETVAEAMAAASCP